MVDEILRLCTNLRRLEIDYSGSLKFSLELCNSKLEHLYVAGMIGGQLPRSALNHFRHLKSLTLGKPQQDTIRVLADALPSLPHLRDLGILNYVTFATNEHYAQLLAAGGSNRWRRIELPCLVPKAIDALANHTDTLEYLVVREAYAKVDQSLVDLLASCTKLRALRLTSYAINANTFINYIDDIADNQKNVEQKQQQQRQQYRQLRPWKCENTLIDFRVHIDGIPRNDWNEECPGQSHDLQEQVLARLGRFHNLQRLELGISEERLQLFEEDFEVECYSFDLPKYQYECVDMTLENGLGMLHQLRQLRHLVVGNMATHIGPKEAEWMIQHWPRLRVIEGLCPDDECKAKPKFQELAPHIQVIEFDPLYNYY
ncbi:hypothetical protein BGW41_003660 [Actinomortierella wolfii]|nr:hypothetical protein BGW41_003660 [Actinomortierella wolfii]